MRGDWWDRLTGLTFEQLMALLVAWVFLSPVLVVVVVAVCVTAYQIARLFAPEGR